MSETIVHDAPETEEEKHLTLPQMLLGIIIRPKQTFEALKDREKSHWWVIFLITVGFSAISSGIIMAKASQRMAEMAATSGVEMASNIQTISLLIGIGTGVLGALFGYLLTALVLFAMSFFLGSKVSYKSMFRMSVWATFPAIIRNLISLVVTIFAGRAGGGGLGGVMSTAEMAGSPIMYALLSRFDIYLLWSLALLVIGFMVTTQLSLTKSLIAVGVYVALSILVIMGFTSIARSLSETLGGDFNMFGMGTNTRMPGTGGGPGSGGGSGGGTRPGGGGGGGGQPPAGG